MIKFKANILNPILSFCFCILIVSLNAQDPNTLFLEGNKKYQESAFEDAVKHYEMVIQSGSESASLFYNLGNAYFKIGNISAAILNYEKAKKIDPTDKDVAYNLKLANTRVVDEIESIPDFFFVEWYHNLIKTHSSDFWAYGFSGLFLLAMLSFFLYFFLHSRSLKKGFFLITIILLIFSASTYFMASSKYTLENLQREGIIFVENIYIKSAPSESSQDVFILHEGTKVKIIEEVEGWNEIILTDGKRGWTEIKNLREI